MNKFKIGDLVQIDNMLSEYHMHIGKIVGIIETHSAERRIYRIREAEGYAVSILVSEKNLVLVSSGHDLQTLYSPIGKNEGRDRIFVPKIKNVILNDPAVIVLWEDGTKTVVKAQGEKFDPEKGLAMAISKKAFGNKHSYYGVFLKNIPGLKKKGAK